MPWRLLAKCKENFNESSSIRIKQSVYSLHHSTDCTEMSYSLGLASCYHPVLCHNLHWYLVHAATCIHSNSFADLSCSCVFHSGSIEESHAERFSAAGAQLLPQRFCANSCLILNNDNDKITKSDLGVLVITNDKCLSVQSKSKLFKWTWLIRTLLANYLMLPPEMQACLCSTNSGTRLFKCALFLCLISDLLNEDKTINRRALGKKVFGNKVKCFTNSHL